MYEEFGPNCNRHVSVPRRGGITMSIWLGPGQGGWKRERDALGGKALCGSQGSGSGAEERVPGAARAGSAAELYAVWAPLGRTNSNPFGCRQGCKDEWDK